MKVIVTGGAGFIGSGIVWKLNSKGIDDIIIVDRLGSSEKWKNLRGKRFEDYIDKDSFLDILEAGRIKDVDMVVHMGACSATTESDAAYLMENNYCYSKRLAQWSLKNKAAFLYASSGATYGDGSLGYSDEDRVTEKLVPLNMYGFSKHLFDLWLIKNKLQNKVAGFKFFNVFGPNEYHKADMRSVVAKVYDTVAAGKPMRLFKSYAKEYADGEQKRDFIYIKDAVEIVDHFVSHPGVKGIFNVGTGNARSWNDLARALFAAVGHTLRVEYTEMPESLQGKYQYYTQADVSKLRKAGCTHVCASLEDTVREYASYLKDNRYL